MAHERNRGLCRNRLINVLPLPRRLEELETQQDQGGLLCECFPVDDDLLVAYSDSSPRDPAHFGISWKVADVGHPLKGWTSV